MAALRAKFGQSNLVTAAITADASAGGKIDAADYAGAAQYVDWYNPMTYDFFGAWDAPGPDGPALPADLLQRHPEGGLQHRRHHPKLKGLGIPASKLLLGIGFYGRGWTGVTQAAPGGTATGAGAGHVRGRASTTTRCSRAKCPATGTVGGTAYASAATSGGATTPRRPSATKMTYKNAAGPGRHVLLGAER